MTRRISPSVLSSNAGLYVSTGGFTRGAEYEATRTEWAVALVTLDELARLIVEHYDLLDGEGRGLVPLVRILWPTTS